MKKTETVVFKYGDHYEIEAEIEWWGFTIPATRFAPAEYPAPMFKRVLSVYDETTGENIEDPGSISDWLDSIDSHYYELIDIAEDTAREMEGIA